MAQKAVELILMRQLASCLAVPVFLVDPEGTLLYYNEPAERLLGRRYDETGEMPASEWATMFTPTADSDWLFAIARVNVAMSNGYDSENSKSLTTSCSTEKNDGPPKTVTSIFGLTGMSHLAWMCTAVSLRSPSNSPVTVRG